MTTDGRTPGDAWRAAREHGNSQIEVLLHLLKGDPLVLTIPHSFPDHRGEALIDRSLILAR